MENKNIIVIEEKEKEDARALTQSFARGDIKSRAYINALGAEVCLKYLKRENIIKERTYNLHNVRKILEEFDISDIMLSNIHIDVRTVFDENQIFIPKSHFEYNLLPDIYIVLKLSKDHSQTEFLGFFEPKLINKNNTNGEYYFMEKEKLSSPIDLKNFIENYNGNTSKGCSEEEQENAKFLMVAMTDHNVNDEDKKKLLQYLLNSSELRDEFIEFENFEMISYQATNIVGLELPINNTEIEISEIPSEEISSDIANEVLNEKPIIDETLEETDNKHDDNPIQGTALLGAEIAGSAVASAALGGIAETALEDTTSNIVNAAANVANITSEAIDMAESIQNMAEQVFSDENMEGLTLPDISDIHDMENNVHDTNEEVTSESVNLNQDTNQANTTNIGTDEDTHLENLNSNLDELFQDYNETAQESSITQEDDDLIFINNSSDDGLMFENSAEDISFSNSYDNDLIFENYDNSTDNNSNSKSQNISSSLACGMHTPISEATELTSIEDIQLGNIPKSVTPPKPNFDQMETMGMEEFHNLLKNYVPQEIKDESETIGFENIQTIQPTTGKAQTENTDNKSSDLQEVSNTTELESKETINKSENNNELTSDDFVEDMPEEMKDLSTAMENNELTSDDFVEDMPEEIEDMPEEMKDLSTAMENNELTSDDFVEDMPEEMKDLSTAMENNELTSDDFVEDMPEDRNTANNIALKKDPSIDDSQQIIDDLSILDQLDQLDSIGLGEIEPPHSEENNNIATSSTSDIEPEITEEVDAIKPDESEKIQVLYDGSKVPELDTSEIEPQEEENFDFRPQERKITKLIPVFAILAAIIIAGSVVGFLMKSKNSIDAETLIQTTPENETLATPEANNSDILANTDSSTQNISKDAEDISPSAPATPPVAKSTKPVIKPPVTPKPINGSKTITLKKLSWEVPDYLSYSENIKKYLQTAGKSIRLTLSSDLLLTNEYIYSNQVKVGLKLSKNGDIQNAQITKSSGSEQVDKIVLQTVKDTLKVVKPNRGEVPTPNYNLTLIIYF